MSFNAEQLGFGRGEALPPPNLQPPPAYPSLGLFPSPLLKSPENVYMGAGLGEQRRKFQASSFYILADSPKADIERYSDKFQAPKAEEFKYDDTYLPVELRPINRRRKSKNVQAVKPNIKKMPDIDHKLKVLEENEEKAESGEEEEQQLDEEVEDEEELEEETDYVSAYFDNGEGYLDDDDDKVDDGPVY
uniref:Putative dna-directed rna polymerase iii subunit rpc7-like protein n=2 Tax=Ornithodoros turicata TaxID=34597 RepID=A0A2R5LFW2_9ACAR